MHKPSDDQPLTLKDACEHLLKGIATPATLRAEAARGNLTIFRIGKRDCTTAADIKLMVERCREKRAVYPVSISPKPTNSGSSATEAISSARTALNQTVAALKNTPRHR